MQQGIYRHSNPVILVIIKELEMTFQQVIDGPFITLTNITF